MAKPERRQCLGEETRGVDVPVGVVLGRAAVQIARVQFVELPLPPDAPGPDDPVSKPTMNLVSSTDQSAYGTGRSPEPGSPGPGTAAAYPGM